MVQLCGGGTIIDIIDLIDDETTNKTEQSGYSSINYVQAFAVASIAITTLLQ